MPSLCHFSLLKRPVRTLFWKHACALLSYFSKVQVFKSLLLQTLLLFASGCATLAWSRGPHTSREEKTLALERTPEAGRSFEWTPWHSRYLWPPFLQILVLWSSCCWYVPDVDILYVAEKIFRSEKKEGRKGEKYFQLSCLDPYSKSSVSPKWKAREFRKFHAAVTSSVQKPHKHFNNGFKTLKRLHSCVHYMEKFTLSP